MDRKKIVTIAIVVVAVLIVGISAFVLTRQDKLVCTNDQEVGSAKLGTNLVVSFKKGYATESKTTMTADFASEALAKQFADSYKDKSEYTVKQDGKRVVITNTKKVSEEEAKAEENKKENIRKSLTDAGLKCK